MGVGGRQDSWDSLVGGFLAWSPEELLRFTSLGSSIPTHRALGCDLDPVLTGSGASLRILLTLPPWGSLTSRSKMSALQKVEKEAGHKEALQMGPARGSNAKQAPSTLEEIKTYNRSP